MSESNRPISDVPADDAMSWLERAEQVVVVFAARNSALIVRASLGIVFLWFGGLKIAQASPVEEFVTTVLGRLPGGTTVIMLGWFEVILGVFFILGRALRFCMLMFFFHMFGTLSVLVVYAEACFRDGNPILLTTHGQYVIKNLVLIAAGLTVVASMRRTKKHWGLRRADTAGSLYPPPRTSRPSQAPPSSDA